MYNNITWMYPDADIWIIGHSLGGALASLLGVTFGAPVVAFESPGERMAAKRLHLPSPVRYPFRSGTIHAHLRCVTRIALHAPCHARMAHRGPHPHGHMHGQTLNMRHCRVRNGDPVSPRQRHRIRHSHESLLVCALDYPPNRNGHRKYPFETVGRGGGNRPRSASNQEPGRLRGTPGTCSFCVSISDLLQDCFQWEYGNFTL